MDSFRPTRARSGPSSALGVLYRHRGISCAGASAKERVLPVVDVQGYMDGEIERKLAELELHGFTVVPSAISPELLLPIREAFDATCDAIRRSKAREHWSQESNDRGVVDFFRAYEVSQAFEALMDLPSAFPILAAALRGGRGGPAGEPRLRTPVTQLLPGHTPSTNAWHRDGGHIRLTYILDDMPPNGGGTAMVAGTHLDRVNSLEERLPLPSWFQSNPLGAPDDAPPEWQVVTPLACMPAGSCLINWTDIVHRRTDNQSAACRRTFWQVFNREGNDLGDRLWCATLHSTAENRVLCHFAAAVLTPFGCLWGR
jgi:hypothetical protein